MATRKAPHEDGDGIAAAFLAAVTLDTPNRISATRWCWPCLALQMMLWPSASQSPRARHCLAAQTDLYLNLSLSLSLNNNQRLNLDQTPIRKMHQSTRQSPAYHAENESSSVIE